MGLSSFIKLKEQQFSEFVTMLDGSPIGIDVMIHEARTDNINLGSRFLLKKLGFLPVVKNQKQITYAKVFANVPLKVVQCCTIIPEEMELSNKSIMDDDLLNIKR
jgi:hypothetical protein